jgi:hypothetical protein
MEASMTNRLTMPIVNKRSHAAVRPQASMRRSDTLPGFVGWSS